MEKEKARIQQAIAKHGICCSKMRIDGLPRITALLWCRVTRFQTHNTSEVRLQTFWPKGQPTWISVIGCTCCVDEKDAWTPRTQYVADADSEFDGDVSTCQATICHYIYGARPQFPRGGFEYVVCEAELEDGNDCMRGGQCTTIALHQQHVVIREPGRKPEYVFNGPGEFQDYLVVPTELLCPWPRP